MFINLGKYNSIQLTKNYRTIGTKLKNYRTFYFPFKFPICVIIHYSKMFKEIQKLENNHFGELLNKRLKPQHFHPGNTAKMTLLIHLLL